MNGTRILSAAATVLWVALAVSSCSGGEENGGTVGPTPQPTPTTPTISVSHVFTSLSFNQPTVLKQAPGDASRWFVGEKGGYIRVFANNPGSSSSSTFLDISAVVNAAGEGGLLGFAFHPNFPLTPEVFVSYTRSGAPLVSYISRFVSNDNGLTMEAGSDYYLVDFVLELSHVDRGRICTPLHFDRVFSPHNGLFTQQAVTMGKYIKVRRQRRPKTMATVLFEKENLVL